MPRGAGAALGALAAIGAASAVWGIGIERNLYTVRHHTVRVLPKGAAPVRILHLSDMHLAPWQNRRREWISHLASLRPDLVIDTGDHFGHADSLPAIRSALASFEGTNGVYVHGSNDLWAPKPRNPLRYFLGPSKAPHQVPPLDTEGLDDFLAGELGWSNLDNASDTIEVRGHRIRFIGTDDPHLRLDDFEALDASIAAQPSADLTIGVTHAPYRRVLDGFVSRGSDLILAGHTHGGQVRLPGYGALVSNCDLPVKQARGLSEWSGVPLNVSAGLGHSIYSPVRFCCRPEVSLITLAPSV
jgi:predicted MPP superfamily phosphohydrolase